MHKRIVLVLILVLALVSVVQATPVDELTAPADYFPADAPMFATVRTDDGYIETLDALVRQVNVNTGEMLLPPGFSVEDLLDQFSVDTFGRSFENSIGTWLGDQIAIGITDAVSLMAEEPSVLIAASVADRAAAEEFLSFLLIDSGIEPTVTDEYALYDLMGEFEVLLADTVLLASNEAGLVETAFAGESDSLSADAAFTETLAAMPGDNYNILGYVNSKGLLDTLQVMMDEQTSGMPGFDLTQLSMGAEGGTAAVGFTIQDGRNLIIDATAITDDEFAASVPGYVEQVPITLDFAAHIPAGTELVIHDNGLGPDTLAIFDALDTVGPQLQASLEMFMDILTATMDAEMMTPEEQMGLELIQGIDLSVVNLGGIVKQSLIPLFAGLTGLNLETDVLEWMTGDYATYVNLLTVDSELAFTFDAAVVVENTDSEKASYIVERLLEVEQMYGFEALSEEIGGGTAMVMPSLIPSIFPEDFIPTDETPELDFIVGSNEDVFVVSTRIGAEFALAPEGDSLLDDPDFTYAAENLFLPDSVSVWYLGTSGAVEFINALMPLLPSDAEILPFALAQVESATITAATPSAGTSQIRLTLTIPAGTEE